MPITESRIDKTEPQRPGRVRVHEFFRDHTGQTYTNIYDVPDTYNTAQHLIDQVGFRDAHLIESESEAVEQRVARGENPAGITVAHITAEQRLRAIVMALMRGHPHQIMRAVQWIDANVSNAQLNSAVGPARRVKVRERIAGLLALKADLDADEVLRDSDG